MFISHYISVTDEDQHTTRNVYLPLITEWSSLIGNKWNRTSYILDWVFTKKLVTETIEKYREADMLGDENS